MNQLRKSNYSLRVISRTRIDLKFRIKRLIRELNLQPPLRISPSYLFKTVWIKQAAELQVRLGE